MEHPARIALRAKLRQLAETVRAKVGEDAVATWASACAAELAAVADEDREWLRDRLQDAACASGILLERADAMRRRCIEQLRTTAAEASAASPYFRYFKVDRRPWASSSVKLKEALARLADGDGRGPSTWGYAADRNEAWYSDVRPGVSAQELASGFALMNERIASIGLKAQIA